MTKNKAGDARGMKLKAEVVKEQELKQLRKALEIANLEKQRLQRQVKKQGPSEYVWAKKFITYLSDFEKGEFIRDNKQILQTAFLFADERKRKVRKIQWEAVVAQIKDKLEDWVLGKTGHEYKITEITPVEAWVGGKGKPEKQPEDDIIDFTFSHPGFIEAVIGEPRNNFQESLTPKPANIHVRVRVQRYEVDQV